MPHIAVSRDSSSIACPLFYSLDSASAWDIDPVPGNDSSPANFLPLALVRDERGETGERVKGARKGRSWMFTYQPRSSPVLRKLQSLLSSQSQPPIDAVMFPISKARYVINTIPCE